LELSNPCIDDYYSFKSSETRLSEQVVLTTVMMLQDHCTQLTQFDLI